MNRIFSHVFHLHLYGCKRWDHIFGSRDVIKSNNTDILRNLQSDLICCLIAACRHGIIGYKYGCGHILLLM